MPFTIETSDWMYSIIYEHFLDKNDIHNANKTAERYINNTMAHFAYFDSISQQDYGRAIRNIYLCHDNILNARFLPIIIQKLKDQNYQFISVDQALKVSVYGQKEYFQGRTGISWLYHWMNNQNDIIRYSQAEPNIDEDRKLYDEILKQNKR